MLELTDEWYFCFSLYFYDFSIRLWICSGSVVCFVFLLDFRTVPIVWYFCFSLLCDFRNIFVWFLNVKCYIIIYLQTWIDVCKNLPSTNPAVVITTVLCFIILYIVKVHINMRYKHKLKMPIPIELIIVSFYEGKWENTIWKNLYVQHYD